MFEIGTKVIVLNSISLEPERGTIIFFEYDVDLDFYWIYIIAEEEKNNINTDSRFEGLYWCMISSEDENLFLD